MNDTQQKIFIPSIQSIEALADIISGGSANSTEERIGIYRSGPQIERFMRQQGVNMDVGSQSRLPALTEALLRLSDYLRCDPSGIDQRVSFERIFEAASDPRDFTREPDRHERVVSHLNSFLSYDGFSLHQTPSGMKCTKLSANSPIANDLQDFSAKIDFDTVKRDIERAMANCESDPESAITSACSTLESVCRSILVELDQPLPSKKDIKPLYAAVAQSLNLDPASAGANEEIVKDVKMVLSGLATLVGGIGALRSHSGTAHGKERGKRRVDARIARLAINASSTVSNFLLDTWQKNNGEIGSNKK